jgi:hypothetical protein
MSTTPKKETPGAVSISNSKLAACMLVCGFKWSAELVQPSDGGMMRTEFMFYGEPFEHWRGRVHVMHARALMSGALEKMQPMHPLCSMMRGQNNHDRLSDAARGASVRLAGVAGGRATTYVHGEPNPAFAAGACEKLEDMALAAALGVVGLPLVTITGSAPLHLFHVARFGYEMEADENSAHESLRVPFMADAAELVKRAPLPEDPQRLALEISHPFHPVVLAYDGLLARAWLKKELDRAVPLLLLQNGGRPQALVTMNATGRIMQKATEHLKAPSLPWRNF